MSNIPQKSKPDYWAPTFEIWETDTELNGARCGRLLAVFNRLLEALDFVVYSVAYQGSSVVLRDPYGNVSEYTGADSLGAMTHSLEWHARKATT